MHHRIQSSSIAVVYLTKLQQSSYQKYQVHLPQVLTSGSEGGTSTSLPHVDLLTNGVTNVPSSFHFLMPNQPIIFVLKFRAMYRNHSK